MDKFIKECSWHNLIAFFLAASLFTLPLSSTAKSICVALALGSIVLSPGYLHTLCAVLKKTWCQATLILFFIALIACCWSPATASEKYFVFEKYSKLIYLPTFVIGFQDCRIRRLGLHAFLLAMTITALLSILKFHNLLNFEIINSDHVFRNHIMTSFMMAFSAYLAGLFFYRQRGIAKIVYASLYLLFSYQVLFVNFGRTGYAIYLILINLLLIQLLPKRQAIAGLIAVAVLFSCCYHLSSPMQVGIQNVIGDWQHYKEDKNTSVGYRFQFHDFAEKLFKNHVILGNGTGSYTYLYRVDKPIPERDREVLEPHSQYWLVLAEFGILGLTGLLFFFGSLWVAATRLNDMKPIAIAILLSFCIGSFSDSLIFYSGSGYLFILLMALCLGEELGLGSRPQQLKMTL
ncbi:MAG: O-antigen ligase family protein [Legionellales bacterium]